MNTLRGPNRPLLVIAALTLAAHTNAFEVIFQPADYRGDWIIDGEKHNPTIDNGSEALTKELAEGTYQFLGASFGMATISVDASGNISTNAHNAFTINGQTITFNTVPLSVDARDYTGKWHIVGAHKGLLDGDGEVTIIRGLRHSINVGGYWGHFYFTAGDDGVVVENKVSAVGGNDSLSFNTVDVAINVGQYSGQWSVYSVRSWATGDGNVKLVPVCRVMACGPA